jgi:putative transposase
MSDNQDFKSNHHVLYSCKYQVVFLPKASPQGARRGVDKRLKEIVYQVAKELSCEVLELEVIPDHVHRLCEVDPQFGVHRFVKQVKGCSSCLLRQEFPHLRSKLPTLWTHSYIVSTVGSAPMAILKQYIENQKAV